MISEGSMVRAPRAKEKRMAYETFSKALESTPELELTVTGRKSCREISIPVWFVRDGVGAGGRARR